MNTVDSVCIMLGCNLIKLSPQQNSNLYAVVVIDTDTVATKLNDKVETGNLYHFNILLAHQIPELSNRILISEIGCKDLQMASDLVTDIENMDFPIQAVVYVNRVITDNPDGNSILAEDVREYFWVGYTPDIYTVHMFENHLGTVTYQQQ